MHFGILTADVPDIISFALTGAATARLQMFGAAGGFWINYIGISAGSLIAYWLARRFGVGLVRKMISLEKYDRLVKWVNQQGGDCPRIIAVNQRRQFLENPGIIGAASIGQKHPTEDVV